MYILGLESSCDETACGIVEMTEDKRQILANIVSSQVPVHRLYGGVVPEIASRAHIEAVSSVTKEALEKANLPLSKIDAIAVTSHPGLIGALLVGVGFAKALAFANNIPLVEVNHIHGHVGAAYLSCPTLKPPFLALVVSGGHTCFYNVKTPTEYEEIGGTRDDAMGEAFDKIGRVLGMPYPSGAAMDKIAYEGNPDLIPLPSPALPGDCLEFSFSGVKTAALNYIHQQEQKNIPVNPADMAAAYTKTLVKAVKEKTDLALKQTGTKTLAVAGGVSANSHLRKALTDLCKKRGVELCLPELSLCGDNGVMVAADGYFQAMEGNFVGTDLNASALD